MKSFVYAAIMSTTMSQAFAQNTDNECTFQTCKAGTHALTHFEKSAPYYSCPNRELATYVNTVISFSLVSLALTGGQMPNISDKTGEPEFTGRTKEIVDMMREKANVQSYDQAVTICAIGTNKRPVMVLNMPENSLVAYVLDESRKQTFWMPILNLDKVMR